MIYKPHNYQQFAIQHILDNNKAGIFMEMGLGKTSVTLTAVEWLLGILEIDKPLIVAPKRVASHVWSSEIKKWTHLSHLKISVIEGTEKQRINALNTKADIYSVSRDNCGWLVHYVAKTIKRWPFDMLILDELSSFKNGSSQRFKAIRKILPYCRRVVGLTGTPASNQLLGLWAMLYLLDFGEALGKTYGAYKDRFFIPGARSGHIIFNYVPKKGAEQQIYDAISPICISMKSQDYLELPERIDIVEEIELENYERYLQFKNTEVLKMDDGFELTPVNAAVFYNILQQYCNGAIYRYKEDGTRYYEVVSTVKLDALVDEVESLCREPLFIFCQLQSDFARIKERLPEAVKIETNAQIDSWNRGEITIGMAHGLSIGHGINLQYGGNHILHFGVGFDLEVYSQSTSRFHRQGQNKSVINKHLVIKGSVEQLILERLKNKAFTQEALMLGLKRHLL